MEIPSGTEMEDIIDKISNLEQKRNYEHMRPTDITGYLLELLNLDDMTLDIAIEMLREIDGRLQDIEHENINQTLGYNPHEELKTWLKAYKKEKPQKEVLKHE